MKRKLSSVSTECVIVKQRMQVLSNAVCCGNILSFCVGWPFIAKSRLLKCRVAGEVQSQIIKNFEYIFALQ